MEIIKESKYREFMEETALPRLEAVKKEGTMFSFDGISIRWYSFSAREPVGNLVIIHGFTESSRKYAEMIWYFVNAGYNVYIYDQRGHGKSYRLVDDLWLTHVERFEDYVRDMECFVDKIVPKDLPLRLFGHSMGGAVSAMYLEKHQGKFPRAVLSSPMIAPARGGYPLFVGKLICGVYSLTGRAREKIFLAGEYTGREPFETSCATSRPRYELYESCRRGTPRYQNKAPTYRWTMESLKVTEKLLKKGAPEAVDAKVLLCSAELDDVVINPAQEKLAARIPDCTLKRYHAKHEIFNSEDRVMETYVNDVLDFLK